MDDAVRCWQCWQRNWERKQHVTFFQLVLWFCSHAQAPDTCGSNPFAVTPWPKFLICAILALVLGILSAVPTPWTRYTSDRVVTLPRLSVVPDEDNYGMVPAAQRSTVLIAGSGEADGLTPNCSLLTSTLGYLSQPLIQSQGTPHQFTQLSPGINTSPDPKAPTAIAIKEKEAFLTT